MTDSLSPSAQAVLDGVCDNTEPDCDIQHLIAAALRAAAAYGEAVEIRTAPGMFELDEVIRLSDLLTLANELENS